MIRRTSLGLTFAAISCGIAAKEPAKGHDSSSAPEPPIEATTERCNEIAATIQGLIAQAELGRRPAALHHDALDEIRSFQAIGCDRLEGENHRHSVERANDLIVSELRACSKTHLEYGNDRFRYGDYVSAVDSHALVVTVDPTNSEAQKRLDAMMFLVERRIPIMRRRGSMFSLKGVAIDRQNHDFRTREFQWQHSWPSFDTWARHEYLDPICRSRLARSLGQRS